MMSAQLGLFLVVLVSTCLAVPLGLRVGRQPKLRATLASAMVCLLLVLGIMITFHPAWLPEFLIDRLTVLLQQSWYAPPAVFLFCLAIGQARERAREGRTRHDWQRQAKLMSVLALLVLGVCSYSLLGSYGWKSWVRDVPREQRDDRGQPQGRVTSDNVVLQSTGYTCGASACATLLRRTGIDPNATEADLVPRVLTRRWGGATVLGMAVGVRERALLAGWKVKILETDWETLQRVRKPVLCSVRLDSFVSHAVVVTAIDPIRGVQVADPLVGLTWWREDYFRAHYLNDAVVVYRQDPFEPGTPARRPNTVFRQPPVVVW